MATLENYAHQFAKKYPRHSANDTWDQNCQALMWKFNEMSHSYDTARDAYNHSKIASTRAKDAPTGAFHFWEIGSAWHVGQGLQPGGRFIFMATRHIAVKADEWADSLGVMSVASYPGSYLGWSLKDGDQGPLAADDVGSTREPRSLAGRARPQAAAHAATASANAAAPPVQDSGPDKIRRIARYLNDRDLGLRTAASNTGHRMDPGASSSNYWRLMQMAGRADGLYGPTYVITGIPGPRSRELEDYYDKVAPA